MLLRTIILCTLPLLAACEAAMPGYTPPPFKENSAVQPMKSGDMDADGGYHMSGQELATDCRHLRGAIMVTISRLRQRSNEVPTSAFAVGANKATTGILGSSSHKGLDREADYARDRGRIEAYNRQLAARNCKTVDIDAELGRSG